MNVADHLRGNNIWFYAIGLGGKNYVHDDNKWKMRTLSSLVDMLNESNVSLFKHLFAVINTIQIIYNALKTLQNKDGPGYNFK